MKPHFKPVPGFSGVFASSDGEIWKLNTSVKPARWKGCRQLRPSTGRDGYLDVVLTTGVNARIKKPVHVLVSLAFHGPRPKGMVTTHMNGVRTDNRPSNLAYRTPQENALDKHRHGTMLVGARNPRSKVTDAQMREIVSAFASGASTQRALAKQYGLHPATVSAICNGRARVAQTVH